MRICAKLASPVVSRVYVKMVKCFGFESLAERPFKSDSHQKLKRFSYLV